MDNQNENYFCDKSTFVPFFLSSVRKMEYSSGPGQGWASPPPPPPHRVATLREREKSLHSSSALCYFCPSFYSFLQASDRQFVDSSFLLMTLSSEFASSKKVESNKPSAKHQRASCIFFFMLPLTSLPSHCLT